MSNPQEKRLDAQSRKVCEKCGDLATLLPDGKLVRHCDSYIDHAGYLIRTQYCVEKEKNNALQAKVKALEARLEAAYGFKYKPGDVVWCIEPDFDNPEMVACTSCNDGKVRLKDGEVRECPVCYGKTQKHKYDKHMMIPVQKTVQNIWVGKDRANSAFKVDDSSILTMEKDLFPTQAEAQAECGRRNKKGAAQ